MRVINELIELACLLNGWLTDSFKLEEVSYLREEDVVAVRYSSIFFESLSVLLDTQHSFVDSGTIRVFTEQPADLLKHFF